MVSIVIPVYNGTNFLSQAVDSALSQTYKNIEVLVVNDGSTDGGATEHLALSYGDKIRYFSKPNGGVSTALNYGIRQMRGDYFSWLSHDDMYTPTKIARQIELLSNYGFDKSTLALCSSTQIDKDSKPLAGLGSKGRYPQGVLVGHKDVLLGLLKYGVFNGCSLLIPRMVLQSVEPFDEQLRFAQDALMWYRIFSKPHSLVYQPNKDVLSRVHPLQGTQSKRHLIEHDYTRICQMILPTFVEQSSLAYSFVYLLAKEAAIFHCCNAMQACIEQGRQNGLLSAVQMAKLRAFFAYGGVRPLIRWAYHFVRRLL